MQRIKRRFLPAAVFLAIILSVSACAPAAGGSGAEETAKEVPAEDAVTADAAAGEREGASGATQADAAAPADKWEDGTYVPAVFTAQGGTGKVTITCPEVVIKDKEAQALIVFSSPHYEWVEVNGTRYDPENAGGKDREDSRFRIPAVLDEEMTIRSLTTAMSEPHEIEYRLLISLAPGAAEDGSGGGTAASAEEADGGTAGGEGTAGSLEADREAEPPVIDGLRFVCAMDTVYAETFDIYTYQSADGGTDGLYRLIDVHDSGRYLILPEHSAADGTAEQDRTPAQQLPGLPGDITVLQAPLDNLYVAATSAMALFDAAGAIDRVKLTGTKAEGWYIDAPKKALADGSMVYAGKYSAPDYELLTSSGCRLAVESMMILHAPEVKEKLEELGIPVFIDTSSNENHPMGRTEWVRLYGVLTGQEEEAERFWERQKEQFAESGSYEKTGLTVAVFSMSTSGNVIVRAAEDYIPRMIELAGGEYALGGLLSGSGKNASVRLSMEEFYNTARDADFLIYNATIESPVRSVDALCAKSALLADFKAVREGHVLQVQRSLYQSPDIAAQMITDLHEMLTGTGAAEMTFLEKLN